MADAVVVGAGPNGLVAANMLADAGWDVLVLEAQPDVSSALKEAGRGRTIRRSIELTPFGEDFCQTCLPL